MALEKRMTFSEALRAFEGSAPHMGEKGTRRSQAELESFQKSLRDISASNRIFFTLSVIFLCVLFCGAFAFVLYSLDKPNNIAVVFGVTGISFMGVIARMTRLWREKVNSDMLLVLSGNLSQEDLKDMVSILLRNLSGAPAKSKRARSAG